MSNEPMVARLEPDHIEAVIELQQQILPHSPLCQLGRSFLKEFYYPSLLKDPSLIGLVLLWNGKIAGFLIGTSNRKNFLSRLAFNNPGALIGAILTSVCFNPRLITAYLKTGFCFLKTLLTSERQHEEGQWGEFITLVTSPSVRTGKNPEEKKIRAANRLIEQGLELMKQRQCATIVAMVEPKNFLAELFFKRYAFTFKRNLTFFGIKSRLFVRRESDYP